MTRFKHVKEKLANERIFSDIAHIKFLEQSLSALLSGKLKVSLLSG